MIPWPFMSTCCCGIMRRQIPIISRSGQLPRVTVSRYRSESVARRSGSNGRLTEMENTFLPLTNIWRLTSIFSLNHIPFPVARATCRRAIQPQQRENLTSITSSTGALCHPSPHPMRATESPWKGSRDCSAVSTGQACR